MIEPSQFRPILLATPVFAEEKVTFRTITSSVDVEAPLALVRRIIELCDGSRTLASIIKDLSIEWDQDNLQNFLIELRRNRVLVDSRALAGAFWPAVENPARFPAQISQSDSVKMVAESADRQRILENAKAYHPSHLATISLLKRRHSTRSFSSEPVSLQSVTDLLWGAYGKIAVDQSPETYRRTVPSAGGLFPLMIHLIVNRQGDSLAAGVYRAHMSSDNRIVYEHLGCEVDSVARAFLDPLCASNAFGIICISGSFEACEQKYGNRAMLFVPLEAGHAAQNVLTIATEANIAAVEIGGFVEELLGDSIYLPQSYRPLTSILFGNHGPGELEPAPLEIDWAVPLAGKYRPPYAFASARVSAGRSWSHGRAASPKLAYVKAVAEAREWAACGNVPPLTHARFLDLNNAIDPRSIIEFHPSQYMHGSFPFQPFDETAEYDWALATNEADGSKVYVLADLVYFPYKPGRPYYAYANSSGVAAHPTRETAVELSTLELIERDTFMLAWLTMGRYPTIKTTSLPERIYNRVIALREIGFHVWIKDHTIDLAPVAFIFAQSKELAYTTCSSCCSFDAEYAIGHALMEVEGSILGRLQNGAPATIDPEAVSMPLDHGQLYAQANYFEQADFLVQEGGEIHLGQVGGECARSWPALRDRLAERGLHLLTIPFALSDAYGGNAGLHIIRSIVPGLVPMTFGFGQEPAGMKRIYVVAKERGRDFTQMDLPAFPHPFA